MTDNIVRLAAVQTERRILPPPRFPMNVAREFVAEYCTHGDGLTLRHWRGGWWQWHRVHWREIEDRAVQASLYIYTGERVVG
jgi:hypothetical protein